MCTQVWTQARVCDHVKKKKNNNNSEKETEVGKDK